MNKLIIYFLFLIIIAIIYGFASAYFIGGGVIGCTEMACMCEHEGELPCNSCTKEELIFTLGIVNIVEVCDAKEILICKNNQYVTRRYNTTNDCETKVTWFDFVLHYTR
jgi:hypothetical protein